ncbi:MAG: VOC family protein [Polyangiales bacterium]
MSTVRKAGLGIKGIDALHFFVRDVSRSRDHYVERMDFREVAVSGAAFERAEGARASLLEAGDVRFVFMQPTSLDGECARWLARHPEGVGRIVLEVEDAELAFARLCERGATPVTRLLTGPTEDGFARWFDITSAFGDTLFRFVERSGARGMLPGFVRVPQRSAPTNRFGISIIDHVTSNFLTLKPATMWMQEVLGLEPYWGIEFHTQDVTGSNEGGSGLKSVVMWDPASGLKFANNEPAAPAFHASQIYKFCEEHRGAGVQHVALAVQGIVGAVRDMRARGVTFMPTPAAYYDMLPARIEQLGVARIEEEIATLRDLEVLVDGAGEGAYLLQIFLREAAGLFDDPQAGPVFIELIERKGDLGFGAGNFRALFESIERQQNEGCAA